MSETPEQLAAILTDRYRIERQIGQGGMATVYLADDLKHDRKVALKVLRPELGAVLGIERFLAEVKITARLDHPHILTLIDSGTAGGLLYYVLPYVRGESLRDLLDREQQLSVERSLEITKHIASALDYAHRQGVVHRDIKPENILLQEGEAMLADFGIALAVKEAGGNRLTETGLSLGTPQYMSPEQATGDRELDARSDVYSLAAVLYEMLVGDPPITGKTVQSVIAKLLTEAPTRIRTVRPTVAEGIDAAVAKALSKVPADRFTSAGEFMRALDAAGAQATAAAAVAAALPPASRSMSQVLAAPAAPHRRARNIGVMIGAAATVTILVALGANGKLFGRVDTSATLKERTQLTFSGQVSAPAVSADGKQLAYFTKVCANADCTYAIDVQDVGATVTRRVLEGATAAYAVEWSPDRRNLLMNGTIGGRFGTFIVSALGGPARLVTTGAATFYAGGDSLLVGSSAANTDSNYVVRVTSIAGGVGDSVIVPGPGTALATLVSIPGTTRFVALVIQPPRGLWQVMDRTGKVTDKLLNACTCGGTASRDALWMARAGPSVTEAIVRVALDGASGRLATHQDTIYNGRFSNLSVTSEGTQLTVDDGSFDNSVVAGGLAELIRGDMPAGPPLVRASSPVNGQVSPDGERLLITRRVPSADGTEERRFAVRAFAGGAEAPLGVTGRPLQAFWADSVAVVVALSVGERIRYSLLDVRTATVLRSLDLDAAGATAITPLANGWAWINPARDRIIVEQGGVRHEIAAPTWFRGLIDIDVSADGSRLLYVGWGAATDDTLRVDVVPTAGGTPVPWVSRFAETGAAQWMNDGSIAFLDWTGPESVTLFKATAPGEVQRIGAVAHRATSMTLSRDYQRATIGWSDKRFDAWMYRVVKP